MRVVVAAGQAERWLPSLVVAVARGGRLREQVSVGEADFAATANGVQRVYPQCGWFHYSNLGLCPTGRDGRPMNSTTCEAWVKQHVLHPLGLRHTTPLPGHPSAQGYSGEPYTDEVVEEPRVDCRGLAPAGQRWSTAGDLCRWTGGLVGSRPDVLPPSVLEEMRAPRTMADLETLDLGIRIGLDADAGPGHRLRGPRRRHAGFPVRRGVSSAHPARRCGTGQHLWGPPPRGTRGAAPEPGPGGLSGCSRMDARGTASRPDRLAAGAVVVRVERVDISVAQRSASAPAR